MTKQSEWHGGDWLLSGKEHIKLMDEANGLLFKA